MQSLLAVESLEGMEAYLAAAYPGITSMSILTEPLDSLSGKSMLVYMCTHGADKLIWLMLRDGWPPTIYDELPEEPLCGWHGGG